MFGMPALLKSALLLSLVIGISPAFAADKKNTFTIKINATASVDYTVGSGKHRKTESTSIPWRYVYQGRSLLGEPVEECIFKWYLNDGQSFTLYNHYTQKFDKVWPPNEVLRKADLSIDTVKVNVSFGSYIDCDGGALAGPGIKNIIGDDIIAAKASFNTPGSPNWNKLFESNNIFDTKDGFLNEAAAKSLFKSLLGQEITPLFTQYTLVKPRLSISDIQYWYRSKLDKEHQDKKQAKKTIAKDSKKPSKNTQQTAKTQTHNQQAPSNSSTLGAGFGISPDAPQSSKTASKSSQQLSLATSSSSKHKASVSGAVVPNEQSQTTATGSMLLLIDTSGSMSGTRIREAKKAAKELINKATHNGTEVAVLAFSGDCNNPITQKHTFSTNNASLKSFVTGLSASGGTPMSAAVEYANVYMANNKSNASRSEMVLLLADGDDGCNIMSPVVSKLKREGILYRHQTVGLELNENSNAVRDLKMVARESGGQYAQASNAAQLTETFDNAAIAIGILDMMGKYNSSKRQKKQINASEQQKSIMSGFGE